MDYSQLLKHCRDEHGVNIDASDLAGSLRKSIWHYFNKVHNLTLHDTELWDILECLQERPKPGNPPPIVATMKDRSFENIKSGEPMETASWYSQEGVLLSNREALEIVEFCERANAPEPVICFRPDWENIDPTFNYVAIDASRDVYAFAEKPQFKSRGVWQDGGESEYLHEINFGKMLWERPKN